MSTRTCCELVYVNGSPSAAATLVRICQSSTASPGGFNTRRAWQDDIRNAGQLGREHPLIDDHGDRPVSLRLDEPRHIAERAIGAGVHDVDDGDMAVLDGGAKG